MEELSCPQQELFSLLIALTRKVLLKQVKTF